MFPQPQRPDYRGGLNPYLLAAVPDTARVIVETGCAEGLLGAELKAQQPERTVIGIEIDAEAAAEARGRLDQVLEHDLMSGPPPIEAGTVDAILFGDVLEHLVDPEAVLVAVRDLLAPGGRVLASIPNMGHHSMLKPLLRGDLMYQPEGLLDATHLRFFTYATIWKLFLDAGYVPRLHSVAEGPISDVALRALTPELVRHRVDPGRARTHLSAYQYVVEALPAPPAPAGFAAPLTFACLVNDPAQLESNLLRSPVLAPGHPHQLIQLPGQTSAAEGLATALAQAEHDIVVLVQQDVYLPRGWDHAFHASWAAASAEFGRPGLAGVFGLRYRDQEPTDVGRVLDRDRLLAEPVPLPAAVDTLDEVVLALPRDTPLEPDPTLGFHFYGSDLALQAHDHGLPVVVLDALCFHNSLFARADRAFHESRETLLAKWPHKRPLRSNMGSLDDAVPQDPVIPWHLQLERDLRKTQRKLADRRTALQETKRALKAAEADKRNAERQAAQLRKRLDAIESSRLWRARNRAGRLLGR